MPECVNKILDHARFAFDEKPGDPSGLLCHQSTREWCARQWRQQSGRSWPGGTSNDCRFVLSPCTFLDEECHTLPRRWLGEALALESSSLAKWHSVEGRRPNRHRILCQFDTELRSHSEHRTRGILALPILRFASVCWKRRVLGWTTSQLATSCFTMPRTNVFHSHGVPCTNNPSYTTYASTPSVCPRACCMHSRCVIDNPRTFWKSATSINFHLPNSNP